MTARSFRVRRTRALGSRPRARRYGMARTGTGRRAAAAGRRDEPRQCRDGQGAREDHEDNGCEGSCRPQPTMPSTRFCAGREPPDQGVPAAPRCAASSPQMVGGRHAAHSGRGQFGHHPAQGHGAFRADLSADPVQPVGTRHYGVSKGVKRPAERIFVIGRPRLMAPHDARSSTGRRAAMARDACLLTARMVTPMVAAICQSDRSQ